MINSVTACPAAIECMMPWPPKPAHWMNQGMSAAASTMAWWSGVSGYSPAQHLRGLIGTSSRNGKRLPIRAAICVEERGIEARVRARRVAGIREADEEPGALSADQHTGVVVDHIGMTAGMPRDGLGARKVASARGDWKVDAGRGRELARERTGGVDDEVGADIACVVRTRRAVAVVGDVEHLGVEEERGRRDAAPPSQSALDNAVRIDDAIGRAERRRGRPSSLTKGAIAMTSAARQPSHVDAE